MSSTRKLFATAAVLLGSSAAMLMGGIARAEPAPAPNPGLPVPGLNNLVTQLMNPATAPQLLQAAASVLTGASATAPTPVAPPPLASAALNVPPPAVPGLAQPAATTPSAPTAQLDLPQVPGLATPLTQQLPFPANLASLIPAGIPLPNVGTPPAAPAATRPALPSVAAPAAAAPAAVSPLPALIPVAGLP
jgi:hypothetical protein